MAKELEKNGIDTKGLIRIASNTHIITDFHKFEDSKDEDIAYECLSMIYRFVTHASRSELDRIRVKQNWYPAAKVIDQMSRTAVGVNGTEGNTKF